MNSKAKEFACRPVWNVRTWPAMPREKVQAAPTARPKVPIRRRGAHCLVVATKRGNARGAKGAGHRRRAWANWVKPGGARTFSGRRQPSRGGTSRMMREYHVRICEGLGVKFPGPTRQNRNRRIADGLRSGGIARVGMATGGRVRYHLKHNISCEECSVIFVGFAAKRTLPR